MEADYQTGHLKMTEDQLTNRWDTTRKAVRYFLARLEKDGFLTKSYGTNRNQGAKLTLCKSTTYKESGAKKGPSQGPSQGPREIPNKLADNQPVTETDKPIQGPSQGPSQGPIRSIEENEEFLKNSSFSSIRHYSHTLRAQENADNYLQSDEYREGVKIAAVNLDTHLNKDQLRILNNYELYHSHEIKKAIYRVEHRSEPINYGSILAELNKIYGDRKKLKSRA